MTTPGTYLLLGIRVITYVTVAIPQAGWLCCRYMQERGGDGSGFGIGSRFLSLSPCHVAWLLGLVFPRPLYDGSVAILVAED